MLLNRLINIRKVFSPFVAGLLFHKFLIVLTNRDGRNKKLKP